MKKTFLLPAAALLLCLSSGSLYAQWEPAGERIRTQWADSLDPENVLPEYPRPIMERPEWLNLNGLWNYAVVPVGTTTPQIDQGEILVPFCIESSLSGVGKTVGSENELWYEREFTVPDKWRHKRILLHFGAVDFRTDVWVNGVLAGSHEGGYAPFAFDITPLLEKGTQTLKVRVWDPTDDGPQAVGKQKKRPHGIWYTPVTGIWQTVWLEPVPESYIGDIRITPDLDRSLWRIETAVIDPEPGHLISVTIRDRETGETVAEMKTVTGVPAEVAVAAPKLWTPEAPNLYDVEIALLKGKKEVDKVSSYCAMRKISAEKDSAGIWRLRLNDRDYFQLGPLDQGWWPDGLYTAPTDEALRYDIEKTKELGFNMIRKHVKVEPARWYTHCDELGMLVWQDMPSGDIDLSIWKPQQMFQGKEKPRTAASEALYRKEWKAIMDFGHNYPSIVVWVPFNEAWGQFKTAEITDWTKRYDPSRLVNSASGGNHFPVGDMLDLHNYPAPGMFMSDSTRINVLGEYGGIGLVLPGHLWDNDRNWGYIKFQTPNEVTDEYVKYARILKTLIPQGFSAAVYTQTTDVEGEVNGLMTYDRKILKVNPVRVREINREVTETLKH